MVDITTHLNELITRLQGKKELIRSLFDYVNAFGMKLTLWKNANKEQKFRSFPYSSESESSKHLEIRNTYNRMK